MRISYQPHGLCKYAGADQLRESRNVQKIKQPADAEMLTQKIMLIDIIPDFT